jgi:hypothetical protein
VLIGFLLLSGIGANSSRTVIVLDLALIGIGMGAMVQVYTVAAQNAVATSQIGVTTAALQFFRTIGGSLAVTGLGALLVGRLADQLTNRLGAAGSRIDPNRLLQGGVHIPPPLLHGTREALASAMHSVFLVGIPIAIAMLTVALLLPERPLRRTLEAPSCETPLRGLTPTPARDTDR